MREYPMEKRRIESMEKGDTFLASTKRSRQVDDSVNTHPKGSLEDFDLGIFDEKTFQEKLPRIIEHIEEAIKRNQPPVPLARFLDSLEKVCGKAQESDKEKRQKKAKMLKCVKQELDKRQLVPQLLSLLDIISFEEFHGHVIYFLGIIALGTLETDEKLFEQCFEKCTSLLGSSTSSVIPAMIMLQLSCRTEEYTQRLLVERLKSNVKPHELEGLLQVVIYATEIPEAFQHFVKYGGVFALLSLARNTSSSKARTLTLKCLHQLLSEDRICSLIAESGRLTDFTFLLSLRNEIKENEHTQMYLGTIIKRLINFLMKNSCWTPLICSGIIPELGFDTSPFTRYREQIIHLLEKVRQKLDENLISAHLYSSDKNWRLNAAILLTSFISIQELSPLKLKLCLQDVLSVLVPPLFDVNTTENQLIHIMNSLHRLTPNEDQSSNVPILEPDLRFVDWINNERLHDVVFLIENEEGTVKLFAHKVLLVTKSKYFETMFKANALKEGLPGCATVPIQGTTPAIFLKVLKLLYCNIVEISSIQDAVDLLITADLFMLDALKEFCFEFIQRQISFDFVELFLREGESCGISILDNVRIQEICLYWLVKQIYYQQPQNIATLRHLLGVVPNLQEKLIRFVINSNIKFKQK